MATRNERDATGFCAQIGQSAEDSFEALAKRGGYVVRKSTRQEDMYGHFDFEIQGRGKSFKVEVKARKRFPILDERRRSTFDFILVEWKGITGHDGWIYGKADVIAIEREDGFYVIPRQHLLEVADKLTSNNWVDNKRDMLYNMYGRTDRQDCVSAILLNDIVSTRNFSFWKK